MKLSKVSRAMREWFTKVSVACNTTVDRLTRRATEVNDDTCFTGVGESSLERRDRHVEGEMISNKMTAGGAKVHIQS